MARFAAAALSLSLSLAGAASGAPRTANLWSCDPSARGAAQRWSAPPTAGAGPGMLALAAGGAAPPALAVVGWPAFSYNTAVATAGPPAGATLFNASALNATHMAFVAATAVAGVKPGQCLAPLYGGVAFSGAALGVVPCAAGDASQAWAWSPADGTLRNGADGGLCLDWGSQFSCAADGAGLPYCDASRSAGARAADLVGRLSAAEAFALLSANMIVQPLNYGTNLGLPARGVPPMWYGECCHGAVAACGAPGDAGGTGCPTSFPAGLSTGASHNRSAWAAAAAAVSVEARALYNQGLHGLACFAPNVNPYRDGRWGRGPEVVSEDPTLSGEYGAVFVAGLQGEGEASVLRTLATLKHGAGYDMENSDGQSRSSFDARISARDLAEYFWPPFKAVAQRARPRFMMASYNAVNGVPSCANGEFMTTVLRGAWGWAGATISDCGGVEGVETAHKYTNTTAATVAAALAAGLDAECGDYYASYGPAAAAAGAVQPAALRAAATRVLAAWFEAGFMNAGADDPYATLAPAAVDAAPARALAVEMAVAGAVLLRNDAVPATGRPRLPLSAAGLRTLAVIGPHAHSTTALLGPYAATANARIANNSIAAALARRGAAGGFAVTAADGCAGIACPDDAGFAAALAVARAADVVVAAFGLDGGQEGEDRDRRVLTLPGRQEDLLNALRETGVPVVLLLAHGGPLALLTAANASAWPAVLTIWYPGQAGGEAAVPLLFGDVSPAGRTMVSWLPQAWADAREVIDMQLQPHGGVPGATYMWNGVPPLFEFGRGLSYTTFAYAWGGAGAGAGAGAMATADAGALAAGAAAPPQYRVNVTNTGAVISDVSVLAFVASGQPDEPLEELFDFGRLAALRPGETRQLIFSLRIAVLASARAPHAGAATTGALFVHPGRYAIRIGDTRASGNFVETALVVTGAAARVLDEASSPTLLQV